MVCPTATAFSGDGHSAPRKFSIIAVQRRKAASDSSPEAAILFEWTQAYVGRVWQ
jgi:hypothetical protein